jgi:N-acetyl-gamma-glutamyl-phosphate reductase
MEQVLGASVLFTPHLAPMSRGILATCYARPVGATSTAELLDLQRAAYADEPFVAVVEGSPSTKATLGSNCAQVTARFDERTGWVIALAAIDNLTKGASGAAVQCANLLLGLPEPTGLPIAGVYP